MKKACFLLLLTCLVSAFFWVSVEQQPIQSNYVETLRIAKTATQLILVGGTNGSNAIFTLYEKTKDGWKETLTTPAYIGKNGLGKKMEGDGKTPIGQFYFTKAFGIAPDPGSIFPYKQVDERHYWDGDPASRTYNTFVSSETNKYFDKSKSEHIIEYTKPYQYCLNISYNDQSIPMLGSAIFLHCYSGKPYTGGCVAIPEESMKTVLRTVQPTCPIIIDYLDKLSRY